MSYISEFTNDVRHIQGEQNLVADALSRIEINNLCIFQESLDFKKVADAQENDDFIQSLGGRIHVKPEIGRDPDG